MYYSYEALRIVHEQTLHEAQTHERIHREVQGTRTERSALQNVINLLKRLSPVQTQQYPESVCAEQVL